MNNQQTASDGLKHATYLWRTERNEQYARSILDELLVRYPDSEEAAAASNLLEEINSAAVSEEGLAGNVSSKLKTASHVTALIGTLAGIALIIFGAALIDSGGQPGNAIIGLFGVLAIFAGGLLTIAVVISWISAMVAQLFGSKGIVALVLGVLAFAYFFFDNFANTPNA